MFVVVAFAAMDLDGELLAFCAEAFLLTEPERLCAFRLGFARLPLTEHWVPERRAGTGPCIYVGSRYEYCTAETLIA